MRRPQLFGKTLVVDFLMTNLALVLGIVMLSNVEHKRKKVVEEPRGLRTEGKYAIVLQWSEQSHDDVDLYVRDPRGHVVYFGARELGEMHLEHDDQGNWKTAPVAPTRKHEERVIIRGTFPGEYIVNVHMYNKRDATPTLVSVRLVTLKGLDDEAAQREIELAVNGAEATAFRFTLLENGTVGETNTLERRLTGSVQQDPFQTPGGL